MYICTAVAESIGITVPTFQELLRSAEQELLGNLFDIPSAEYSEQRGTGDPI